MSVKRWNGTSWDTYAGATNLSATQSQWKYTAVGGETTLTGSDDSLITLAYTVGQEALYINGVLQVRGTDYTATNGTSVTLTTPLVVNDTVQITSSVAYAVANVIPGTTITTKGDLITGSAIGTPTRLPIGTNNSFLVADSTQATGIRWSTNGGTFTTWRKQAAGGETTLTGTDDFALTLAYTAGQEMVYINGVLLERGVDYTASNGSTVTGLTALVAGDVATVITIGTFQIPNAIQSSTVTTKGDLIVGNGSSTVTRLASPSNTLFLVANSATGSGWQDSNSGDVTVMGQSLGRGANSSGKINTAFGAVALNNITTGDSNTAVGEGAGYGITTGSFNVAMGIYNLYFNTAGSWNTAIGAQALNANTTGNQNTGIGQAALAHNTVGVQNTAVGAGALVNNTTANVNTAVGFNALYYNTTGIQNVAVGAYSMFSHTTGYYNVAVGDTSLYYLTSGLYNVAVGQNAGSGTNAITTGSNNVLIGYNAQATSATVSNQITLGSASIATLRCQQTSITSLSDARDKKEIETLPVGLDFVKELKPVKFTWDYRQPEKPQIDGEGNPIIEGLVDVHDVGFIAQDLVALEDSSGLAEYLKLTLRDNPERLEATQGRLIPVLVKAIQELSAEVDALKKAGN
jgi:hypothetical protein